MTPPNAFLKCEHTFVTKKRQTKDENYSPKLALVHLGQPKLIIELALRVLDSKGGSDAADAEQGHEPLAAAGVPV